MTAKIYVASKDIGSLFLVIGSTLHKLCCPEKVREFSVAQWVYEHKHPRHEYLSATLQRPVLLLLTIFFLFSGAGITLWITGLRISDAIKYSVESLL